MGKTYKDKKDYKARIRKGKGLMPSRIHRSKKSKQNDSHGKDAD
jgi:hypothetical protein